MTRDIAQMRDLDIEPVLIPHRRETLKRCLIVVADDLGRSPSVNHAIAEGHDRRIITAASIMAGGNAFPEAVEIARKRSRLSVGLHVTLCDGKAVLDPARIPDLVGPDGSFEKDPALAGLRYTKPGLLPQIDEEVKAQFDRLDEWGLRPTHVDGHHHLHMHPVIFGVVCRHASSRGINWIRIPKETLLTVLRLRSRARGVAPFFEWIVFGMLGLYNMRTAKRYGLNAAHRVYGLSRTGGVDENYLLTILSRTSGVVNELFTHPDVATESGLEEMEALVSTRVLERIAELGISLVGYRELSEGAMVLKSAWEGL